MSHSAAFGRGRGNTFFHCYILSPFLWTLCKYCRINHHFPEDATRENTTMGFLESCWEALLQVAALGPYHPYQNSFPQQPILGHPGVGVPQVPLTSSPGNTVLSPEYASPGFQCVYPKRWRSCNTPTSRDCWLQDTESTDAFEAYSQVDINTDCTSSVEQGT